MDGATGRNEDRGTGGRGDAETGRRGEGAETAEERAERERKFNEDMERK